MINFSTSKELRIKAGEIIKKVQRGERFVITYRGKPVALMVPFAADVLEEMVPRAYEEAWKDIEQTLNETEAAYPDWEEAIKESRRSK